MIETNGTGANPFARGQAGHVNAGTVAIEQARASSEVQAQLFCAKQFPRDQAAAFNRAMEACRRPSLASVAMYAFPRGKETVTGPSIRLAETLAANWGNLEYGIRELSRKDGVSEMQAFCWDVETNVRSVQNFTVRHERDTRAGKVILTDERDIYEMTANLGGRRLRSRIMAILPGDLIEAAIQECRKTMAGDNTVPLVDRVRKMITAFDKLGVPLPLIEKRQGKPVAEFLPEDLVDLTAAHNAIRDGMSSAGEWFGTDKEKTAGTAAAIKAIAGKHDASPPPASLPAAPPEVSDQPVGPEQVAEFAEAVAAYGLDIEDARGWLGTLGEGWPQNEAELTRGQFATAMRGLPEMARVLREKGGAQ